MMKSLSILLIDDDEIERMKFKKVCAENNFSHKIIEADNGANALEKLKDVNNSFDIIISDLNMPVINGLELLKIIKSSKKFKSIPTIIMSTSKKNRDLKKCFNKGVSGYFIKSLLFSEYSSKVTSLLNYWSKNQLVS